MEAADECNVPFGKPLASISTPMTTSRSHVPYAFTVNWNSRYCSTRLSSEDAAAFASKRGMISAMALAARQ